MIDLWKHSIELKLGAPVYWWPLPRVNPLCEPGSIRMSWKVSFSDEAYTSLLSTEIKAQWGGHILFLDMPGWQASDYRRRCVPVSRMPNTPTMLPLHNINATSVDSSVPGQISAMNLGGNDPRLHSTLLSPPQGLSLGSQGDQAGDILEAQRQLREIYWCVDKVWTEPSQTWLCTLSQISDDRSLCKLLSKEFKKVHGLRGQIFSWKKCTGVDFISVRVGLSLADFSLFSNGYLTLRLSNI